MPYSQKIIFFILPFIFCLQSCSLTSKEDFESQAKGQLEQLTSDLKAIEDLEALQAKKKLLKKRFLHLTNLMMDYHLFLEKQPHLKGAPSDELVLSAAHLKFEFERLFQIEGALEVIAEAEKDSFTKLTLMEESLNQGL